MTYGLEVRCSIQLSYECKGEPLTILSPQGWICLKTISVSCKVVLVVGVAGLEPAILAATDFKSVVYTSSTTLPGMKISEGSEHTPRRRSCLLYPSLA